MVHSPNPITYIKAFELIRDLLANIQAAKIHGHAPGYFSFNVPGGRCETCEGDGVQKIEMQFMADLYLTCESCKGKRSKKRKPLTFGTTEKMLTIFFP